MGIFLSWSGDRSKRVAQALKDWLPVVFDDVNPWLSDRDIQAGRRWAVELGRRLEKIDFGIICLTRENLESPWILFESGALSKALEDSYVCPYLLDVDMSAVTPPLSQFQATRTEKASTLELLQSINAARSHPSDESQLLRRFEGLWSQFEEMLEEIPKDMGEGRGPTRPTDDILEELVETVRTADRRISDLYTRMESFGMLTSEAQAAWQEVVRQLKRRRQALTAAVYGEAEAIWEGDILSLSYPEEQGFHVGMANDPGHKQKLLDAVETVYGSRPKDVRVSVRGNSWG